MSKYAERNYAPKTRKLEKNDLRKHSDRNQGRETDQAGSGNCIQYSWEEQKEEISTLAAKEAAYTGEENGESKVGIGQPIQISGEVCRKVRSRKPRSRCSSSRDKKIRQSEDGKNVSSGKEES